MFILICFVLLCLFILICLYVISSMISPPNFNISGSHIIVTGGSSGIGKAVAIEAAKRGANVTILARNVTKLNEAKAEIGKHIQHKGVQKIFCISIDVSKDFPILENSLKKAEDELGPVDCLINCAGYSVNGYFEEIPLEDFQHLLEVNYLGSVYATRSVLEGMKRRKRGRIVFVSSQAGQMGLIGFTAYSASKFALRGFAEALQMEVKPYNIRVTLSFPPDTDTPGYEEEMKNKPVETRLISETSGLFQPEDVAKIILRDTVKGKFLSYVGLDGYLLSMVTCGMSPVTSVIEALQQVLTASLFRLISLFYLASFDRIVARCKEDRKKMAGIADKQKAS